MHLAITLSLRALSIALSFVSTRRCWRTRAGPSLAAPSRRPSLSSVRPGLDAFVPVYASYERPGGGARQRLMSIMGAMTSNFCWRANFRDRPGRLLHRLVGLEKLAAMDPLRRLRRRRTLCARRHLDRRLAARAFMRRLSSAHHGHDDVFRAGLRLDGRSAGAEARAQ